MRHSIKTAIWIRVIATICSILLVGVIAFGGVSAVKTRQGTLEQIEIMNKSTNAAQLGHQVWINNLGEAVHDIAEFTGTTDPTSCTLGKWISGGQVLEDSTVAAILQDVEPLHKKIHESAVEVMQMKTVDPAQAQAYYEGTIRPNIATLNGMLTQILDRGDVLLTTNNKEMDDSLNLMMIISSVCFLLAFVCLGSLIFFLFKSVVRPILLITKQAEKLSTGSLDFNVKTNTKGEIGQLIDALTTSVYEIKEYVQDIDRAMGELAKGNFDVKPSKAFIGDFKPIETSITAFIMTFSSTFTQIDRASGQVSSGAEQISVGAQTLSQGATEQAASVQELAATINDISHQVSDNANHAVEASKMSRETNTELENGKLQMSKLVQAMNKINSSSEEISKIIKSIDDIASQTNLLALNAAVEAARAGAAGKGFAVVAEEIRNLAGKSSEASKNTAILIENSIKSVREGDSIAAATEESLNRIVDSSARSAMLIEKITLASQEQANAVAQVTQGIDQISSVVQTNSATAEESAAASEELSGQAQLLKSLVERFHLADVAMMKAAGMGASPAPESDGNLSWTGSNDKY